jgi:acetyl-CoA carboxylase biotin carboxyl carrier protein
MATVMMTGWAMVKYYQPMAERNLTYGDLVQIVELIKSTSHFSEFRLKVGDIEVSLRRSNGSAPAARAAAAPAPSQKAAERQFAEGMHVVRAPMVGTFYRAPAPGAAPFVSPGQAVEPDATVCIIEVMKLMNSIEAGVAGVVKEVLVENGAGVEHGTPLVLIEPK